MLRPEVLNSGGMTGRADYGPGLGPKLFFLSQALGWVYLKFDFFVPKPGLHQL